MRAVTLLAGVLGKAGERGQKRRLADANNGIVTWNNPSEIERWMDSNAAEKAREALIAIGKAQDEGILDRNMASREDFMTDDEILAQMNELPGAPVPRE